MRDGLAVFYVTSNVTQQCDSFCFLFVFSDDLPVNVSVLLLTLASPDESSLVIDEIALFL